MGISVQYVSWAIGIDQGECLSPFCQRNIIQADDHINFVLHKTP